MIVDMTAEGGYFERVVRSFAFSFLLFIVWGTLTALHARSLIHDFTWPVLLWTLYNGLLAVLFLIRSRPSIVSLQAMHWLVALLTSFAGLFFRRGGTSWASLSAAGDYLIFIGVGVSATAAISLGRSYDFLPALRGLQTKGLYAFIRHPMYLASMVIRLGYLLGSVSLYNGAVFLIMLWLYDRRAAYEEVIMSADPRYRDYLGAVRFRFLPFLR